MGFSWVIQKLLREKITESRTSLAPIRGSKGVFQHPAGSVALIPQCCFHEGVPCFNSWRSLTFFFGSHLSIGFITSFRDENWDPNGTGSPPVSALQLGPLFPPDKCAPASHHCSQRTIGQLPPLSLLHVRSRTCDLSQHPTLLGLPLQADPTRHL